MNLDFDLGFFRDLTMKNGDFHGDFTMKNGKWWFPLGFRFLDFELLLLVLALAV